MTIIQRIAIAVAVLLGIAFLLYFRGGSSTRQEQPIVQAPAVPVVQQRSGMVLEIEPQWDERASDGSIFPERWSRTLYPRAACTVHYDSGHGSVYKTRIKLHGDWEMQGTDAYVAGNELQVMVLKAGIHRVPITLACPY